MADLFLKTDALISDCGKYRYRLSRIWDEAVPPAVFIMLNPSTADASQDDPTIRRCVGFARAWGTGGILVVNLFALRSPDPRSLVNAEEAGRDPCGPDNDRHILGAVAASQVVVGAWGVGGRLLWRGRQVQRMLAAAGINLQCLGTTRDGYPRHPLYVTSSQPLVPLEPPCPNN